MRLQSKSFAEGTMEALTAERIARAICGEYKVSEPYWQRALLAPLFEFLNRPGKHFRGGLVAASWAIAGGEPRNLPKELPLILELLHAGSLIVDDIQDGSSMRRGAPALHELYGMPLALNTGNWLYFAASSLIDELELACGVKLELSRRVRSAVLRCHHGQALDLSVHVSTLQPAEIPGIVTTTTELKTAALVELAAMLGAIAAGGRSEHVDALARFGRELGIALQMLDDLGGVMASNRRDKGAEDLRHGRPTWVWAWASENLPRATLLHLLDTSKTVKDRANIEVLREQLKSAIGRRGHLETSTRLRAAYERLVDSVPPSPALQALALELERLEGSYG